MATFEAIVITGVEEAVKAHDPLRWQDALERALPVAYQPVVTAASGSAQRGRSGKLARSVRVMITRVAQGLIGGIEVLLGTGEPYGHLVERGHKIIARGPSRSGRLSKARRGELRSALKARRARGAIGFVAPRPFAEPAAVSQQAQTVDRVEMEMRRVLGFAS